MQKNYTGNYQFNFQKDSSYLEKVFGLLFLMNKVWNTKKRLNNVRRFFVLIKFSCLTSQDYFDNQ